MGAFVATYLGQALGWYSAGEGAGLVGATVGAIVVLLIWGAIAGATLGVALGYLEKGKVTKVNPRSSLEEGE